MDQIGRSIQALSSDCYVAISGFGNMFWMYKIVENSYLYPMYKVKVDQSDFSVEDENGEFIINDKKFEVDILEYNDGKFHVLHNNKSYSAELVSYDKEEKAFQLQVNHSVFTVVVQDRFDQLLQEMGIDVTANKKVNDIKAPMPGMVLQVLVEDGQAILKGDAIVVLEAMKMENIIKASADGTVKKVQVKKGAKVEKNEVMVYLT